MTLGSSRDRPTPGHRARLRCTGRTAVGQQGVVQRPVPPDPAWRLRIGPTVHDLSVRTLVVAALDPVPDGGPDASWWTRAVAAAGFGADALGVAPDAVAATAAVRARRDRVVPALRDRAGRPVAVGTAVPEAATAATAAGADLVLDPDGSAGPDLVAAVAAAGATLIVGPGADPDAVLDRARAAGLAADRLALDPGPYAMPAGVVRACVVPVGPVGPVGPDDDARTGALAAVAEAVTAGARVVITPDVVGTVKVVRMLEAIVARVPTGARAEAPTGAGGSR
jgi:hypothetical protein